MTRRGEGGRNNEHFKKSPESTEKVFDIGKLRESLSKEPSPEVWDEIVDQFIEFDKEGIQKEKKNIQEFLKGSKKEDNPLSMMVSQAVLLRGGSTSSINESIINYANEHLDDSWGEEFEELREFPEGMIHMYVLENVPPVIKSLMSISRSLEMDIRWNNAMGGFDSLFKSSNGLENIAHLKLRDPIEEENDTFVANFLKKGKFHNSLKSISFDGVGINSESVEQILEMNPQELKKIYFNCADMKGVDMARIAESGILQNVEHFSMAHYNYTEENILPIINSLEKIKALTLGMFGEISDATLESITKNKKISQLRSLELIESSVTDKGLEALASFPGAKGLKKLNLEDSSEITHKAIESLGESEIRLEELKLNITGIGPEGLRALANEVAFEHLKKLDISFCSFDNDSLRYFFENGPELESLFLTGANLNSLVFNELIHSERLKKVKNLDIGMADVGNYGFINRDMKRFVNSEMFSNLKKLSIFRRNISGEQFSFIAAAKHSKLEELLIYNNDIDDAVIEGLRENSAGFSNLKKLIISGNKITETESVITIVESIPSLEYLNVDRSLMTKELRNRIKKINPSLFIQR